MANQKVVVMFADGDRGGIKGHITPTAVYVSQHLYYYAITMMAVNKLTISEVLSYDWESEVRRVGHELIPTRRT